MFKFSAASLHSINSVILKGGILSRTLLAFHQQCDSSNFSRMVNAAQSH